MASTYSPLKIELIGTGEQAGTWGTTTNTNLGTALEEAIVGSADVTFSSADVTLTLTNTNAAQVARSLRLKLIGTSGGARNLILGSGCQIEKPYLIDNTLADTITVKNTSGTGVDVLAGEKKYVYNDGTNVVEALTISGGINYEVKTANYTAKNKEGILANTSGGAFTITLPATPAAGDQVVVADAGGNWGTNNLTIGRNGSTIEAIAQDLVCDISGVSVQLVYSGTTWEVYAQIGGNGGTVVTEAGTQTLTNKTINLTSNTLVATSAQLASALTDETGTGVAVFGTNPTLTGVTLAGEAACADNLVTRATLKDYAIEGSAIGNVGATRTFDLAVANFFSATVDQASTFTFSNPPASGDFGAFVMELTNGGAFVVTFPASVDWPGGTAPTLTASGKDQLVFTTRDGGTTYFGFVAGLDIKSP